MFELSPFSGDTCLEPPRSVHVLPVAGSLVTGDSFSPKGTPSGLLSLELSRSRWFGSNASPAPPPTPNHTGMFVSNCVPGIRTKCSSFPEAFHLQALPEATKHRRAHLCSQIGITDHGHQTLLALLQGNCHHLCPLLLLSFRNSATARWFLRL